jgi:hypothetical protein
MGEGAGVFNWGCGCGVLWGNSGGVSAVAGKGRVSFVDPVSSIQLGVSRCCASHFSLLAQRKVTKRKGTLHCVDAVHRFLALLTRKGAAGNSQRYALLRHPAAFSLPGCAAQRQRQGVEYRGKRDCSVGVLARMAGREFGLIGARRIPTVIRSRVRRALIGRFSYSVVYRLGPNERFRILVLRHHQRHSEYGAERQ